MQTSPEPVAALTYLLGLHKYRDSLGREFTPVGITASNSLVMMRTDKTEQNWTMTAQQVQAMELLK